MNDDHLSLFSLLPEIYRDRDAAAGDALRALSDVIGAEVRRTRAAIRSGYDDWFPETADDGGLRRLAALFGPDAAADLAVNRATLANAVACSRRRGAATAAIRRIEDATGWISEISDADRADGRTALSVWRKPVYQVEFAEARPLGGGRYSFSPFGVASPLFRHPAPRYDIDAAPGPENLPAPLSANAPTNGGAIPSLALWRVAFGDDGRISACRSQAFRLSGAADADECAVIVDPAAGFLDDGGRAESEDETYFASYGYCFSGPLGGGPYARGAPAGGGVVLPVSRAGLAGPDGTAAFASLGAALAAFRAQGGDAEIRIMDSARYRLTADDVVGGPPMACAGAFARPRRLLIAAEPGTAPSVSGPMRIGGAPGGAEVSLAGLWIDGAISVAADAGLTLTDCAVSPVSDQPSVTLESGARALEISRSICGGLRSLAPGAALRCRDSAIAAPGGTALSGFSGADVDRTSVVGALDADLDASADNLVWDVDPGGAEPDASGMATGPFASTRFGDPSFLQLSSQAGRRALTGAADGSELGAFGFLNQPERERRLRAAIADCFPVHIRPTTIFRS